MDSRAETPSAPRFPQCCPIYRFATSLGAGPWIAGVVAGTAVGTGMGFLGGFDAVTSTLAALSACCTLAAAWGCPAARAAIQRTARRDLELLTQNIPGALFIYDEAADGTGSLRYASTGFVELCGRCQRSLPAGEHAILDILHPDERPVALHAMRRARDAGKPWIGEYRRETPDGDAGWLELRAMPTPDGTRAIRWHGYAQDITRRKVGENALQHAKTAAQRAERAKGELVANVSHELRTPLAAIVGYAEILRDTDLDQRTSDEAIEAIGRNGQHALEVINDIVDAERASTAEFAISSVPADVAAIAEDTVKLLRIRAQSKGIALDIVRGECGDLVVATDPLRVRQILMNLVGNAIRFTDHGGVRLELQSDGRAVTVSVVDTGVGMDAAQLSRLFSRYAQVDEARAAGGSGLGLAISRQLAKLLGGNISVTSVPGQGSTFRLHLPRVSGRTGRNPRPEADASGSAHGADRPLADLRVLIAEDSHDNARLLTHHLTRAGAQVTWANNGREAVALARAAHMGVMEQPFDLILMDVEMPGMDGLKATKELRASGLALPIIALTASAGAEAHSRCLDAGCDDFATKPLSRNHLVLLALRWAGKHVDLEKSGSFEAIAR